MKRTVKKKTAAVSNTVMITFYMKLTSLHPEVVISYGFLMRTLFSIYLHYNQNFKVASVVTSHVQYE